MITWGINALNHDASISVFAGDEFKLHQRASEFSGKRGEQTNTSIYILQETDYRKQNFKIFH